MGDDIYNAAVCQKHHGEWVGQKGNEYHVLAYAAAGKVCKSPKRLRWFSHCTSSKQLRRANPNS